MCETDLSPLTDMVTSYLSNILNINILLVTITLALLFWLLRRNEHNNYNPWWLVILLLAIILGIFSIILNLLTFRDMIDVLDQTKLAGFKNFTQPLSRLDIIFYLDLIIILLLICVFFGLSYEKSK